MRFGGDAWVRQTDATGGRLSGIGNSVIVLKRRFPVDDASAFGLEAGATLPTARRALGSDKSDVSLNGIYSVDSGDYHTDLNLAATRVGAVQAGEGRTQTMFAGSLSKPLNDRWGVVAELSGTRRRGTEHTSQFLFAANHNVTRQLTPDAGVARGLRSGPSAWSAFSGMTLLVGRVL